MSDWSDEFSFTTVSAGGLPGVPTLSSPTNGAVDVSTGVITLNWEAEAEATSYDYQMSTVPSFSTLVDEKLGVTEASVNSVDLGAAVTYYWHVRAVNENGSSAWSNAFSFTTMSEGGGGAPGVPVLTAPADGATGISPSGVNLAWNASSGALDYDLQLATNAEFTSLVEERTGLTATSTLFNDIGENTAHYWRVRASNADGTK